MNHSQKVLAILVMAATSAAAADGWPKGLDPRTVGSRVVNAFLSTEPEDYRIPGVQAESYGGGKYVCYSVASLWMNALEFARMTGDGALETNLCRRLDPFLPVGAKADKVPKTRHVDFSVFGCVPLEVAILQDNAVAKEMGLRCAQDQWMPPRETDVADFPKWLRSHYVPEERQRELLAKGYSGQTRMWIDDMYMINVLQSQAYRASGDRTFILRAAHEMSLYLDLLQLENGLFNHAKDVPFRWGRGNGWMAAGMPMILQFLKPADRDYARILAGYRKMMLTLRTWQRESGLWGQLVDDPESWDETSGSLMFAYGFLMGCRFGWLDASVYGPRAEKTYLAVASRLDAHGNVPDVCCGTGAQADRKYYFDRPKIAGDPHGQAPLLWCCNVLLMQDGVSRRW